MFGAPNSVAELLRLVFVKEEFVIVKSHKIREIARLNFFANGSHELMT
jgi:hypothetical protein